MPYYDPPTKISDTLVDRVEREVDCAPEDIAIARRHGMAAWHIDGLRLYCRRHQRLLIMRSSKMESRQFHFSGDHKPKPVDVKEKTAGGQVSAKSLRYPNTERFFSDYDLMSLWQWQGGEYKKIVVTEPELDELNLHIGNREMFQHGCNDDWLDTAGRPKNQIRFSETFIAFNERSWVFELNNARELYAFYSTNMLAWPSYSIS